MTRLIYAIIKQEIISIKKLNQIFGFYAKNACWVENTGEISPDWIDSVCES